MPAGIMVPARQAPPLMGRNAVGPGYGSTSGLSLGQSSLLDATQHYHQQMDMITPTTAESEIARIRDDEFESKSGSENVEGASGDDQEPNQRPKKKRYHRHTQHQIQEMEAFFKECPHPDDKQRKELSRELGLEPLQVKFWFQNKRTQMKVRQLRTISDARNQHERQENQQLRSENEKLRADNMRYKEALSNASCPNCGGPTAIGEMSFDEQQLRIENVRLREEVRKATCTFQIKCCKPSKKESAWPRFCDAILISPSHNLPLQIDRISGIAAKYVGKPLGSSYPLLSPQVPQMTAEFQMPSPLVPTRDSYFVRYCKQHADGTWVVVDVSLDSLHPNPVVRCRRRPSGCLIQEMPNGYSKVTWVEHVEVDDRTVHTMYKPLVNSGLAFGAKRWVSTLDRQCERLASVMASNIPNGEVSVITTLDGRKSMLKLAERMVISFCSGVSASVAHQWTTLSGACAEDVRVMTKKSVDDPGRPPGIVLSAATSFWLPVPPKRVFDFLRDENTRSEWDILSNGGIVHEMAHIANGRDEGNCVSLLRVNSTNSNQSNMLILQESCSDPTGSYVIYAPVDLVAMNVVLNGGDPDYVALLPSGFAILPDGPPQLAAAPQDGGGGSGAASGQAGGTGGSLLTVAFQILVDSQPNAKLSLGSVATVNSLIACTVDRIKSNVLGEGAH
ncbi:hypothetical protein Taro_047811 [Colocasia esculenta]|uniref:Uncharacterized protein n=1 Tax=Colocasia esculenta TaxID=4460 RepID=A0A843X1J9_COLES|nr:hypothetical protein [Colocasia esculenta]